MLRHRSNREWEKERKYSPKQLQGQEETEWEEVGMKERRNEDGSESDQDVNMQFRLWLDAMNIPREEACVLIQENWQYVAGGIWGGIRFLQHWRHCTVQQCATKHRFISLFPVLDHLAPTTFTHSNKNSFLPIGLSFPIHLTLNKLFGKGSCHLQTVCRKQNEIIHRFNG